MIAGGSRTGADRLRRDRRKELSCRARASGRATPDLHRKPDKHPSASLQRDLHSGAGRGSLLDADNVPKGVPFARRLTAPRCSPPTDRYHPGNVAWSLPGWPRRTTACRQAPVVERTPGRNACPGQGSTVPPIFPAHPAALGRGRQNRLPHRPRSRPLRGPCPGHPPRPCRGPPTGTPPAHEEITPCPSVSKTSSTPST